MAAHARNIVDGNSWNELDLGSNENEGDDLSKWRMLEKREPVSSKYLIVKSSKFRYCATDGASTKRRKLWQQII